MTQISKIYLTILVILVVMSAIDAKSTVGFIATHGCIKCTVLGEYDKKGRHMSFPRIDCAARTNESFRNLSDVDHHKQTTPLQKLPIDLVKDIIVADSLHLIDLGGCNAFGHACFGGHGKRSEIPGPDSGSNETPYPIFKLLQESNKIPNEVNYNSGSYNSPPVEEIDFRYTVYELFKNWLEDYRRVHQSNNPINNNNNNINNNNNNANDMDFPVNNKNIDNRNFI